MKSLRCRSAAARMLAWRTVQSLSERAFFRACTVCASGAWERRLTVSARCELTGLASICFATGTPKENGPSSALGYSPGEHLPRIGVHIGSHQSSLPVASLHSGRRSACGNSRVLRSPPTLLRCKAGPAQYHAEQPDVCNSLHSWLEQVSALSVVSGTLLVQNVLGPDHPAARHLSARCFGLIHNSVKLSGPANPLNRETV
jgi:hypothetical protein